MKQSSVYNDHKNVNININGGDLEKIKDTVRFTMREEEIAQGRH
jgi:hypothetical protein